MHTKLPPLVSPKPDLTPLSALKSASKTILMVIGVAFLLSPQMGAAAPNIVYILIDDMDNQELAAFGGTPGLTPNLSLLASQGMIFKEAYVSATVCTPSRYSFITGRNPGRSTYPPYLAEFPTNRQGNPEFNVGVVPEEFNLGKGLKTSSAGYVSGWVGKFHLGFNQTKTYTSKTSNAQLSQEEYIHELQTLAQTRYDALKGTAAQAYLEGEATTFFKEIETIVAEHIVQDLGFSEAKNIYEGNVTGPFSKHNLEWTTKAALDFIEANAGGAKPFYLHYCPTLMHGGNTSWNKSMDFPNMTGAGWIANPIQLTGYMASRATIRQRVSNMGLSLDDYAGYAWLDEGIGAIMKKLDEKGITNNTIFIFMPDHGSANKASLFSQGSSQIPMIIRYPALIAPGTSCSKLVQNIDVVPTLFELAVPTAAAPTGLDGKSFKSYLTNPTGATNIRDYLYFELGSARSILKDNYRYIVNRYPDGRRNTDRNSMTKRATSGFYNLDPLGNLDKLITDYSYMGTHAGVSSRGMEFNPEYLTYDQLYDVGPIGNRTLDAEMKVGTDVKNIIAALPTTAASMKSILEADMKATNVRDGSNRPYGTFNTGSTSTFDKVEPVNYEAGIETWRVNLYDYFYALTGTVPVPTAPVSYAAPYGNSGSNALIGPTQDYEGDGFSNLLEYALGTSPLDRTAGLSTAVLGATPGLTLGSYQLESLVVAPATTAKDYLTINFDFNISPADFQLKVQTSSNLTTWEDLIVLTPPYTNTQIAGLTSNAVVMSAAVNAKVGTLNSARLKVRSAQPVVAGTPRFFRYMVTPTVAAPAAVATISAAYTAPAVVLSWTAPATPCSYSVERAPKGTTNFSIIGVSSGASFSDNTAQSGVGYDYRIRAVNAAGVSDYSASRRFTVP